MPKRGIALAGGGARGPYQVGVWRALSELGISYDIVTGTSVGALNGALMVQGDFQLAKELWETLTPKDVAVEPESFARQMVLQGGLDITPLENLLRESVDEEKIRNSPIEFGLVTTQYPHLKPVQLRKSEIPKGELVDYLLASASYFPFFQRRKIGDVEYMDGAFSDNLPAKLALDCGAQELIAVDLHSVGIVHPYRAEPPVVYIHSYWNLGNILAFDPLYARRNMQIGYQDAMRAFRKLEGHIYAFYPGDTRRNTARMHNALLSLSRESGIDIPAQYKRLPGSQIALRERSSRFYRRVAEPITLGRAVTSAAEVTGELLGVLPDQVYRLPEFNRLCLEKWREPARILAPIGRAAIDRMVRQLEEACRAGKPSDAFWRLLALSPKEFVAASYLMALRRPA